MFFLNIEADFKYVSVSIFVQALQRIGNCLN